MLTIGSRHGREQERDADRSRDSDRQIQNLWPFSSYSRNPPDASETNDDGETTTRRQPTYHDGHCSDQSMSVLSTTARRLSGVSGFHDISGFEQRLDGFIFYVVGRLPPGFVRDGRIGSPFDQQLNDFGCFLTFSSSTWSTGRRDCAVQRC